jgi:hypothetical protein
MLVEQRHFGADGVVSGEDNEVAVLLMVAGEVAVALPAAASAT